MKKFFRILLRIAVCMCIIQGMNIVLENMNVPIAVGMNGYTVVVSGILGLPGILGLYVIGYFF